MTRISMLFRRLKIMEIWWIFFAPIPEHVLHQEEEHIWWIHYENKNHGACVHVLYNEARLALHSRGSQCKCTSNQFGFC